MYTKVALACLLAVALARPEKLPSNGYGYAPPPQASSEEVQEGMPFDFAYAVKDAYEGLDFGHRSNSDGVLTTGEYSVALPDGRTMTVTYTVDYENGYQAKVNFEGEARYPEDESSEGSRPSPSYSAPAPTYQRPSSLYDAPRQ